MPGLMRTFDALSDSEQDTVREMSNAARGALRAAGVKPDNNDDAARFDEACAVFYARSRAAMGQPVVALAR